MHTDETRRARAALTRRDAVQLSAGSLLALGLWPGQLRAADNGQGGEFTFIAVNDLHYLDPKCEPWFERVVQQMKATVPRPEFVLVIGDVCENGTPAQHGAIRAALDSLGLPFHTVIGNHDWTAPTDREAFDKNFPGSTNYSFVHRGWQFVGMDSSQGQKSSGVSVQARVLCRRRMGFGGTDRGGKLCQNLSRPCATGNPSPSWGGAGVGGLSAPTIGLPGHRKDCSHRQFAIPKHVAVWNPDKLIALACRP